MRCNEVQTMKVRRYIIERLLTAVLATVLLSACSLIDDDPGKCGYTERYELDYELELVTNMTTEIQTQLTAETDISVAAVLKAHLSDIFTDFAHDVDLSFYDTKADSVRLHHDEHIMDANQQSYTLYIPRQKYMHLAVANIVDDPLVDLLYDEHCHTSQIVQTPPRLRNGTYQPDTIDSHTTGLFTARQLMEMIEGVNQTFNVKLFMANCAAALVIDPRGEPTDGLKVYTTGFATAFNVADSTYVFSDPSPIVRTMRLESLSEDSHLLTFCSVNFPSREPKEQGAPFYQWGTTRSIIETEEPFIAQEGDETLWQFRTYITNADGTVTETILSLRQPLRAGQLKIIKAYVRGDGSVQTDDRRVGVSVTLDWNEGTQHDIPL